MVVISGAQLEIETHIFTFNYQLSEPALRTPSPLTLIVDGPPWACPGAKSEQLRSRTPSPPASPPTRGWSDCQTPGRRSSSTFIDRSAWPTPDLRFSAVKGKVRVRSPMRSPSTSPKSCKSSKSGYASANSTDYDESMGSDDGAG